MTVKITKPALNLREEIAKAQSNNAETSRIGSLVSDSIDAVAIDAETLVVATQTPASASATGTAGTIAWDASYIYICTAANTWKRVAIATW